jgi:hypothetical protein
MQAAAQSDRHFDRRYGPGRQFLRPEQQQSRMHVGQGIFRSDQITSSPSGGSKNPVKLSSCLNFMTSILPITLLRKRRISPDQTIFPHQRLDRMTA